MKNKRPFWFKESEECWNALTIEQQHMVVAKHQYKSRLLRKKDSLHHTDVFIRVPRVLSDVREALEADLKPVAFSLIGDAVILRLERNEDTE